MMTLTPPTTDAGQVARRLADFLGGDPEILTIGPVVDATWRDVYGTQLRVVSIHSHITERLSVAVRTPAGRVEEAFRVDLRHVHEDAILAMLIPLAVEAFA